jgi:hypothetical protein
LFVSASFSQFPLTCQQSAPASLMGLALVCLFLGLSQPAGLNHSVASSKPWLASWTEPAPGLPTASIIRAQNSIRFVLDLSPVWSATVCGLQANLVYPASRLRGHRNRTDLGEFPIKAGSSKHPSSRFSPRNSRPTPSNLKSWAFATAFSQPG